jgi:flagellar basal-body rod protein FlgB
MTAPPRIITGLADAMRNLADRQKVIAQNIANSETPGFKAREVEAPDFGRLVDELGGKARVLRPQVAVSARMIELGSSMPRAGSGTVRDKDITETKPDGNNITLEEQAMKLARIQTDYAAVTSMYRKQMQLIKLALGSGRG